MELVPAATLDRARLAALFTAAYEGYAFPIEIDAAQLERMIAQADFDLEHSVVAIREGEPVGLAMLGIRGERGWIGGMGVVAAARREGIGLALMEAVIRSARGAGLVEVSLEVLEDNTPAITLYERLGFHPTRMLDVWSWTDEPPASSARALDVAAAHDLIRAKRTVHEPWQRRDEVLEQFVPTGAFGVGDRGAALLHVGAGRVAVLQLWADDTEIARELLAAARAQGDSLNFLNVPETDHASVALRQLGATLDTRQHEMSLDL